MTDSISKLFAIWTHITLLNANIIQICHQLSLHVRHITILMDLIIQIKSEQMISDIDIKCKIYTTNPCAPLIG